MVTQLSLCPLQRHGGEGGLATPRSLHRHRRRPACPDGCTAAGVGANPQVVGSTCEHNVARVGRQATQCSLQHHCTTVTAIVTANVTTSITLIALGFSARPRRGVASHVGHVEGVGEHDVGRRRVVCDRRLRQHHRHLVLGDGVVVRSQPGSLEVHFEPLLRRLAALRHTRRLCGWAQRPRVHGGCAPGPGADRVGATDVEQVARVRREVCDGGSQRVADVHRHLLRVQHVRTVVPHHVASGGAILRAQRAGLPLQHHRRGRRRQHGRCGGCQRRWALRLHRVGDWSHRPHAHGVDRRQREHVGSAGGQPSHLRGQAWPHLLAANELRAVAVVELAPHDLVPRDGRVCGCDLRLRPHQVHRRHVRVAAHRRRWWQSGWPQGAHGCRRLTWRAYTHHVHSTHDSNVLRVRCQTCYGDERIVTHIHRHQAHELGRLDAPRLPARVAAQVTVDTRAAPHTELGAALEHATT